MLTVSWLRWRLAQFALMAAVTAATFTIAVGDPFTRRVLAVTYAAVWVGVLATAAVTARVTQTEVLLRAPLRTRRIPLAEAVVVPPPAGFPVAGIGRRGRGMSRLPWTAETRRLFEAIENAR